MSRAEASTGRVWLALAPLLVGTFTGTISNSVVNVPMADILHGLDVPLASGALVVVAFNLTFAVLMPVSGWLGDRCGRRRVFCFAMVGLGVGAAGAALSPGLPSLVAFRALQGLATASVLPTVMSLIATMFGPDRRGRALALWASVNGAGQAAGPAVGGFVGDWLGWRAIFWPTIPIAALALGTALWLVPRDPARPVPLEWRGASLITLAAALLLGAASAVPSFGVASPAVWGTAAGAIVAATAYVLVEHGRATAFLPPKLLLEPRYLRSSLAVLMQMFCLGATLLGVPLYLTQELHLATATAGAVVLALPLTMVVLAPAAGFVSDQLSPRIALRGGLGVLVLGQVLLTGVLGTQRGVDWLLVGTLVISGAGVAFVQTPAASGATRSRAGKLGAGLGLFNLIRFGGSALGAAWVAVVVDRAPSFGLVFAVCSAAAVLGLAGSFAGRDPAPEGQVGGASSASSALVTELKESM